MLHAILLVALAQVAQPAAPQWVSEASSAPNGIADFSAHGAGSLADIPPPNVDVDPTDYKPGDTSWVDRASGLSFARSGAPAAWHGSPFYPDGFEESQPIAAGGMSDTVGFQLGTGPDALDFAGDFWACIPFVPLSITNSPVIFSNGGSGGPGYYVQISNTGTARFVDYSSGANTTNTVTLGAINVICFGRDGIYTRAVLNGGAFAVGGSTAQTGTDRPAYIGKFWSPGFAFNGLVSEIAFSGGVAATEARLRAAANSIMRCAGAQCIPEDSGTVSHVTFDASANPVDTKGLAWTKNGTPTALAVPYVWPGNRTPKSKPSVSLDGTNDWFTGPTNVPRSATGITVDCAFQPGTGSSAGYTALIAEDDRSANRNWGFYATAASAYVRVYINGNATQLSASSPSPDLSWNVAAFSYDASGANGTGILRINVNGVATTPLTNGATPINTTAAALTIGASNGVPFKGKHGGCRVRYGFAADAAQLDRIVRQRIGLLATKPATDAVSFSRNDVHSACCPVTDASCFALGANFPCITRRGIERAGQTANALTQSDLGAWTVGSGGGSSDPVRTANAALAPDGTQTADRFDFPAVSTGWSLGYITFSGTAAAWNESVWARTDGGTATIYLSMTPNGSTYQSGPCVAGPTWSRCWVPGTLTAATWYAQVGVDMRDVAQTAKPAQTVYLWQGQTAPGSLPLPLRTTTGSVYSGPETVASVPDARKDFGRFAVLWTGTLDDWTPDTDYRVFWSYGSSDAANSVTAYLRTTTNMNFFVYDSVPAGRTWNLTPGALADGQHSILFDAKLGTFRASIDGVLQAGYGTPSGTGIPTASLPLNLCRAGTNTYSANCWIKRVVQSTTERSAR